MNDKDRCQCRSFIDRPLGHGEDVALDVCLTSSQLTHESFSYSGTNRAEPPSPFRNTTSGTVQYCTSS